MKHIKKFENYESDEVYTLDYCRKVSNWIDSLWDKKLEDKTDSELSDFFTKISNIFNDDISDIIDRRYSDDKLHYHQNGKTGDIDTSEFLRDFDEIKKEIENIL